MVINITNCYKMLGACVLYCNNDELINCKLIALDKIFRFFFNVFVLNDIILRIFSSLVLFSMMSYYTLSTNGN